MQSKRKCFLAIILIFTSILSNAKELSLTEQLENKAKESAAKSPDEVKKIMADAIEHLKKSAVMKSALRVGDKMPEFKLPDVQRGMVSSSELLKKGSLIVTFYRGGWCPYCNLQLHDLQTHLKELRAAGAELVAISPELPDHTAATVKKNALEFYVLSDSEGKVAGQFGLNYPLGDELKGVYKRFGIDLEASNGNKRWELPISATYIVNKQGIVTYAFVDADYKKRAETTELIKFLKK